jgi:hypothetical protein
MLRRYALFGLLMAAALLARVALVADKQSVEHDEAISYLAAAGHLAMTSGRSRPGSFPTTNGRRRAPGRSSSSRTGR